MEDNAQTAIQPYRIRDIVEGGSIDLTTTGNVAIPLSLNLLSKLVRVRSNDRVPDVAELAMFANVIIEQRCNPYLNECWLVMMRGKYVPVIAAQKRVAKAQSLHSYDGYEWGWIGKDGTRCPNGPESTLKEGDIAGVWGRIYFKDRKVPFYHEVLRSEYPHSKNDRPITMLLKTARDQIHKYAFANEMGNLCTENEPQEAFETLPAPECETPPRGERRKKVDSMSVEGEGSKVIGVAADGVRGGRHKEAVVAVQAPPPQEPVEPAKEEAETDVAGSAGEVVVGIGDMYIALKAEYDEKGGDDFNAWAADALCVGDDEVEQPRDFTVEMIESLARHLVERGV